MDDMKESLEWGVSLCHLGTDLRIIEFKELCELGHHGVLALSVIASLNLSVVVELFEASAHLGIVLLSQSSWTSQECSETEIPTRNDLSTADTEPLFGHCWILLLRLIVRRKATCNIQTIVMLPGFAMLALYPCNLKRIKEARPG